MDNILSKDRKCLLREGQGELAGRLAQVEGVTDSTTMETQAIVWIAAVWIQFAFMQLIA